MYAGRKVEEAPIERAVRTRRAIRTRAALLGSMPHLGDSVNETGKRLVEIPGMVPSLKDPAPGCLFAPRCPNVGERCAADVPPLERHTARPLGCVLASGRRAPRSARSAEVSA